MKVRLILVLQKCPVGIGEQCFFTIGVIGIFIPGLTICVHDSGADENGEQENRKDRGVRMLENALYERPYRLPRWGFGALDMSVVKRKGGHILAGHTQRPFYFSSVKNLAIGLARLSSAGWTP